MDKQELNQKIVLCADRAYCFQKQEIDAKLQKLKNDGIEATVGDFLLIFKDTHHLSIKTFVSEMIKEGAIQN